MHRIIRCVQRLQPFSYYKIASSFCSNPLEKQLISSSWMTSKILLKLDISLALLFHWYVAALGLSGNHITGHIQGPFVMYI
jgi:hypothetical protein